MAKGFILTLDAMLAMIIALILGFAIFSSNINFIHDWHLTSVGNDLLSVLEQKRVFNSYINGVNATVVSDMQTQLQILPSNYCGDMTVSIYKMQNSFPLEDQFNVLSTDCVKKNDITKVKRIFVDYKKQRLGLAEITMWLK